MNLRRVVALVLVLFLLTVLVRAPARWALSLLPTTVVCAAPSGSVWHGGCGQLRVAGAELVNVDWRLHPLSLLRGRLDLDLHSADPRAPGTARAALGPGRSLKLSAVRAELPVDSGFLPVFPPAWSGQLQLALENMEISGGILRAIRGTLTARALAQRNPPMPYGSFELRFDTPPASDGTIAGVLHDLDGPLAVNGRLTVRRGSEYELSGQVATRPDAASELAKAVEFLGPADAQGRRPFSLAGSF